MLDRANLGSHKNTNGNHKKNSDVDVYHARVSDADHENYILECALGHPVSPAWEDTHDKNPSCCLISRYCSFWACDLPGLPDIKDGDQMVAAFTVPNVVVQVCAASSEAHVFSPGSMC